MDSVDWRMFYRRLNVVKQAGDDCSASCWTIDTSFVHLSALFCLTAFLGYWPFEGVVHPAWWEEGIMDKVEKCQNSGNGYGIL